MKGGTRPPLTRWGKIDRWIWLVRIRVVVLFASFMRVPVDVHSVFR